MNIFIYTLSDPKTNQIRYIGKTTRSLLKRFKEHLRDKNQTHKVNWIKKLKSENLFPIIELLDEIPENEWRFWEQHYICLYKSWGFNLTNLDNGGDGPDMWTEAMKQKISIARKNVPPRGEEERKAISERMKGEKNPMYGKKHSDEVKEKISKINTLNKVERGKKLSEGRKGKTWEEFYGKEKSDILKQKKSEFNKKNTIFRDPKFIEENKKRLKGKKRTPESIAKWRESIKGYIVPQELRDKMSENRKGTKNANARGSILQYDLKGNFIQEFETGQDAANSLGKKSFGNISSCLTGKIKSAHGYIWKRKKDLIIECFNGIGKKHALINSYIEKGEEIPFELRKNFITFPLIEDPYGFLE